MSRRGDGSLDRRGHHGIGGLPAARPPVMVGLIAVAAVMLHRAPAFTADFHPGSGGQPAPSEFTGQVTSVADGDTLDVSRNGGKEKVDLFGVDCPERGQAYAEQAARFTSSLTLHRKVMVIPRGGGGGEVFLDDGRSLARELLQAGLAWWDWRRADDRVLGMLEAQAKVERRGLWADQNPVPPWIYRGGGKGAAPGTSGSFAPPKAGPESPSGK